MHGGRWRGPVLALITCCCFCAHGRWVQFTTSLPLPMGIGVDEGNVITEVDAGGAGATQGLEVGDELLWLDGMEVRDGLVEIVEALDRGVVNHLVVLRRVDAIRPADQQPDVGFAQEIGPVELPLPMGMGMNAAHVILELDAEGSAMHDGTLQLGDTLISVDGVALDEKTSIVEALDRHKQFHTVLARRIDEQT